MGEKDNYNFLKYLKDEFKINLNKGQENMVLSINGPVLVIAVPGAGKTYSICIRTLNLIKNYKIEPARILNLTFSKASALDMQKKFMSMFKDHLDIGDLNSVVFATIHSFAYKIILKHSKRNNIKYTLIEEKKRRIFNDIYIKIEKDALTDDIYELLIGQISFIKNKMIKREDIETSIEDLHHNFLKIYDEYETYKKQNYFLDFDDMLTLAYNLLSSDKDVREYMRGLFDYITLDEAQDTSTIQFEIIKLICNEKNNICFVGDDDQSIYEFRSADTKNFINLEKTYINTKKVFMEQNYRSTKKIVGAANEFIKKNIVRYNKNIYTENEKGENLTIVECQDVQAQIDYIIKEIKRSSDYKENAILFRNNISSFLLVNKLFKNNIPFYAKGSNDSFFKHWVLNDILNFFRVAAFPKDIEPFEKIALKMNKYISKKMIAFIKENEEDKTVFEKLLEYPLLERYQRDNIIVLRQEFVRLKNKTPKNAISYICNDLCYGEYCKLMCKNLGFSEGRIEEIIYILEEVASSSTDVFEFEDNLFEFKEILEDSKLNYDKNVVTLSTMHSSKGLEWDNVYMIDLSQGIFPSATTLKYSEENYGLIEAERRLFYVGVTRAKKKLNLLFCRENVRNLTEPSMFVKEIFKRGKHYFDLKKYYLLEHNKNVSMFAKTKEVESEELENLLSEEVAIKKEEKKKKESINDSKKGKKKKKEKYMIGTKINHINWGEGEILKKDTNFLEVRFDKVIKKINIKHCEKKKLLL